jgi:hypothetical protein
MNMRKIQFTFSRDKTLPRSSVGRIIVGPHGVNHHGEHCLSPDCLSLVEVEEAVKRLQLDLEEVLVQARKKEWD